MTVVDLVKKHHARRSTLLRHTVWVCSTAEKVNINNEMEMSNVRDLSVIMDSFIETYDWGGVSSNNVIWKTTDAPLRVIRIPSPDGKEFYTLINPVIKYMCGQPMPSFEGCGSIPGLDFLVPRAPYVVLEGILLEGENCREIRLEYGIDVGEEALQWPAVIGYDTSKILWNAVMLQHECDHLDGILLLDRSNLWQAIQRDEYLMQELSRRSMLDVVESMRPSPDSYLVPGTLNGHNGVGYAFKFDEESLPFLLPSLTYTPTPWSD